jgi:hypothetical protein
MPSTPIELCSLALVKIGANAISSFEEGTLEAHVSGLLYPLVRDTLLSAHPWNFATTQLYCAKLTETPLADYTSSFELPSDCLRILSTGANSTRQGPEYKVQSGRIFTNAQTLLLTYIKRTEENRFPAFFKIALVARLASEFCIPLTDSTTRWKALQAVAEDEFRRAKSHDAQEDTPPRFHDFSLIESRY